MDSDPDAEPVTESASSELRDPSPLGVGLLILFGLLFVFWLCDALFPADTSGYPMSSAQITGMALTYSASPAFMIGSLLYARRRTRAGLEELVRVSGVAREAAAKCDPGGDRVPLTLNLATTIAGIFVGALQVTWPLVGETLGGPRASMVVAIAFGNILTWIVVAQVVVRRVLASADLRRLGEADVDVDLLRLDGLLPFGRIATLHFLIVVMTVSLSAFQSLDAELRWVNYGAALAAGIPAGIVLMLLPMLGVRNNVRRTRRKALDDLDVAIANADRMLEPEPLSYLGDLLRQRDAVQQAREWPLDTTAFSRIAIYFVIPPIAWVGGALAEILIQAAL